MIKNCDKICIGTWNVRTLYQPGKLENAWIEKERMKIDILGISEVRWKGCGEVQDERGLFIYSGGENHEKGVGVFLSKKVAKSLKGYWAISERVLVVKLQSKPFDMNIIQVYAPTADSDEEEIESFYDSIDKAMEQCKNHEVNILMGDFNAKVGEGRSTNVVGPYGLGQRNDRGEKLVNWCLENNQVILNTWFRHQKRRLWTWKSPGNRTKNQIDYITINEKFRNSVIQAKTRPGADIDSDHVPVIINMKIKLKIIKKAKKYPQKRYSFTR